MVINYFAASVDNYLRTPRVSVKVIIEHEVVRECRRRFPWDGGFYDGVRLNLSASTPDRLVFYFFYKHECDNVAKDGTTLHEAIVTPSLLYDFNIEIKTIGTPCSMRAENMFKDMLQRCLSL